MSVSAVALVGVFANLRVCEHACVCTRVVRYARISVSVHSCLPSFTFLHGIVTQEACFSLLAAKQSLEDSLSLHTTGPFNK